jgi:cyclopropane-fatty-acyl-phospholipid synthase
MQLSPKSPSSLDGRLHAILSRLEAVGAQLDIQAPGLERLRVGGGASPTRVVFHDEAAFRSMARQDALALAEAYLRGDIDVEGDLTEVMKIAEIMDFGPSWWDRLRLALRLALRNRIAYDRESIAFHYDRPPEFFLPWFDRWRSYSHGFYASPHDSLEDAQARKLQYAVDALDLKPGSHVLDMGAGWGCFLEYAGLRGIHVHGITISRQQHEFVRRLIDAKGLPCTIELVNLFEYRPRRRFEGAVFLGTFEHVPEYGRVIRFLAEHLEPRARLYADFSSVHQGFVLGAFMKKHIWPGAIQYVATPRLVRELTRAGFNVHELADDTLSYACTVRDWGDALEAQRDALAARFGEPAVRAFLLFLRGSWYFLRTNKTQAYHLVAGRDPAPLERGSLSGT